MEDVEQTGWADRERALRLELSRDIELARRRQDDHERVERAMARIPIPPWRNQVPAG